MGIHLLTPSELMINSKMGIKARGQIPWSDDERNDTYSLSIHPDYQHKKGMVAREINLKYHDGKDVRSIKSIYNCVYNYKKSLENNLE